jgi:hypothetical protein
MTANLPPEFDLRAVEDYLRGSVSASNTTKCMAVICRLASGTGVKHASKPDETFLSGKQLTPRDDLEKIREQAAMWLPYQKGNPHCIDKGHGWALNHPIQKLINYQKHLLGVEVKVRTPKRKRACLQ